MSEMVNKCCVLGCISGLYCNKSPVSSFHFPLENEALCSEWLRFMDRDNWKPSKCSVVCIRHFEEKFIRRGIRATLRWNRDPVPTLFPPRQLPVAGIALSRESPTGLAFSADESDRSGLDTSLPARQTASIFKQPVTKKTNHRHNRVRSDASRSNGKTPQQLFKEKRLSGLNAMDVSENIIASLDLPKSLQAVGPDTSSDALLRRIATHLHQRGPPITGQTSSIVMKDACVWLNTQQPLCKAFVVTEDDVRKQERRVQLARERLEAALKHQDVLNRQERTLQP